MSGTQPTVDMRHGARLALLAAAASFQALLLRVPPPRWTPPLPQPLSAGRADTDLADDLSRHQRPVGLAKLNCTQSAKFPVAAQGRTSALSDALTWDALDPPADTRSPETNVLGHFFHRLTPLRWGISPAEAAVSLVPLPASSQVDPQAVRVLSARSGLLLVAQGNVSSPMAVGAATRFAAQLAKMTADRLVLAVCMSTDGNATLTDIIAAEGPSSSGTDATENGPSACSIAEKKSKLSDWIVLSFKEPEALVPPFLTLSSAAEENYSLRVPADNQQPIHLFADSAVGLLRGLSSLAQLLTLRTPAASEDEVMVLVPVVEIDDQPTTSWRGLLLDVARRFITLDAVLALLPLLEAVKINTLHLHLTDDQVRSGLGTKLSAARVLTPVVQGWRYESKQYPKLNEIGGDFYTHHEIRSLVEAARSHGVRVVPELEFPGHTDVVLVAFPFIASKPVHDIDPAWGSHDTCVIPGAKTWEFMDKLFAELSTLFPDEYVHIGGDEAQACMGNRFVQFALKTVDIAAAHGKKALIWGDSMEPIRSKSVFVAAVQWWREPSPRHAHSGKWSMLRSHRYYLNENMPAHWSYVNPVEGLAEPALSMGGEAALWSEFVDSGNVEFRLWPGLGAVAEALWLSPASWCLETLDSRLSTVRDRLHNHFGLGPGRHNLSPQKIDRLLTEGWAGGDQAALQCMSEMLEPMGHYCESSLLSTSACFECSRWCAHCTSTLHAQPGPNQDHQCKCADSAQQVD